MSYEKYNATQPQWSKGVLITFWVFQMIFIILNIAGSILGLIVVSKPATVSTISINSNGSNYVSAYNYSSNSVWTSFKIGYGIILAFAIISFIFTVTEIVFFARRRLGAPMYFAFELIKFMIWGIVFGIAIFGAVLGIASVLSILANVVVMLLFLATLIYGSVMFHRHRMAKKQAFANYPNGNTGYNATAPLAGYPAPAAGFQGSFNSGYGNAPQV